MIKVAIIGFRHAHIFDLYQRILDHPGLELVATCEEDVAASLMPGRGLEPDFCSFHQLLAETDCDVVALGDVYGKRAAQAIAALEAGKHIIGDKPLCISLTELDRIATLARENHRCIGLMLDLRDHGNWIALREAVASGRIGEVQTLCFSGQHPLLYGTRPSWYFQQGMHGGTINDIAIHALDFIPWVTGLSIAGIDFARAWNAKAAEAPHFADCAQLALRLANEGGVLGDVSYLAPDTCGYKLANYWRVVLHGTGGCAETSCNAPGVTIADDTSKEPEILPPAAARPGGYLEDFLGEISGTPSTYGLTTESNLRTSRMALEAQAAAQHGP
jgi:predicted dehydrogenase